jgi:membrane protease YdiL (CAAX protease family)
MNGIISIAGVVGILLGLGLLLGLADRRNFSPVWLLVAALLVLANDAMLTRLYGLVPDMFGGDWNWQGKVMALLVSLAIASLPLFGWKRTGLTLRQKPGAFAGAAIVFALYCLFFLAIALVFPNEDATSETVAFQLTMPGLEEELFYRGILLLALNEAFRGRARVLGIDWGWGAILSSLVFGLAHAFSYSADAGFEVDLMILALTGIPSLLAVWLRERTGSLLLPVLAHNAGNSLPLMV